MATISFNSNAFFTVLPCLPVTGGIYILSPRNWRAFVTVPTNTVRQWGRSVTSETATETAKVFCLSGILGSRSLRPDHLAEAPRRHCLGRLHGAAPTAPRSFIALPCQPQPLCDHICAHGSQLDPVSSWSTAIKRENGALSHDGQASWRPGLVFWSY